VRARVRGVGGYPPTRLAKLTEGAPFPCRWLGLDYCDRLAADHQPVIDYYFHDGKERLAGAVSDLLAATRMDTSALTEPGQTQPTLEAIHRTINAVDPHFRYDFRVDTLEMDADGKPIMPTIHDSPGLVAAISSAGADGIAVTFSVFARFKEATSEQPVPGQFTLVAEPGVRQPTPHRYSSAEEPIAHCRAHSPPAVKRSSDLGRVLDREGRSAIP